MGKNLRGAWGVYPCILTICTQFCREHTVWFHGSFVFIHIVAVRTLHRFNCHGHPVCSVRATMMTPSYSQYMIFASFLWIPAWMIALFHLFLPHRWKSDWSIHSRSPVSACLNKVLAVYPCTISMAWWDIRCHTAIPNLCCAWATRPAWDLTVVLPRS